MGYAIQANGAWRAVNSDMILAADETYGETLPEPSQEQVQAELLEQMKAAVDFWLDIKVAERGYSNILAACSYPYSTITQWRVESLACIAWRDAVWSTAIQIMDECQRGARAIPTPDELIAQLPGLQWPE